MDPLEKSEMSPRQILLNFLLFGSWGLAKATAPSDPQDSLGHGEGQLEVLPPLCGRLRLPARQVCQDGGARQASGHAAQARRLPQNERLQPRRQLLRLRTVH